MPDQGEAMLRRAKKQKKEPKDKARRAELLRGDQKPARPPMEKRQ